MTKGRRRSAEGRAEDWPQRVRRLEAEVAGLRRGMRSRGLIEQAKGRLAERLGLDPEDAFRHLAERSQQTNATVADLAADVVGAWPDDGGPAIPDGVWTRRVTRLRASIDAATEPAGLVSAVLDEVWLGARMVALFAAEADGALRLVAAQGLAGRVAADWRWVPSAVRTPAGEAVRCGEPIWLADATDLTLIGPGRRRAALPIVVDQAVVAALEVAFDEAGPAFDPDVRRHLRVATDLVATWWASAAHQDARLDGALASRWVEAGVDASVVPAALFTPLWSDDETICDFRIDYANPEAVAFWRAADDPVGRRLLDTDPDLIGNGGFDTYVRAYLGKTGMGLEPGLDADHADRRRAARVGGRLLVTWQPTGDRWASAARLTTMEEVGGFGWGEWGLSGQLWSPGLYRIVGRSAGAGPLSLERLLAAVAEDDRPRVRAAVERVRRDGHRSSVDDVRLRRQDGQVRTVRVLAWPRLDQHERARAVLALFQDRTEARRQEQAAAGAAERLATQRVQSAVERAQTEQLRAAFFPPPWTRRRHGALAIVARHAAPTGIHRFRGDFYELNQSEAALLVAVGDVFGTGVAAAQAMVRLRHAVRVLALAGVGPADMLKLLNRELSRDEEPPLASLVLASLQPDGSTVSWAQAGHYSPILVRQGRARSLRRPRGDVLGLTLDARYAPARVELRPADLLVFFTDGVFQRWDPGESPIRRLAAECEAAQRDGGAEALVARLVEPEDDEACLVAVQWSSSADAPTAAATGSG